MGGLSYFHEGDGPGTPAGSLMGVELFYPEKAVLLFTLIFREPILSAAVIRGWGIQFLETMKNNWKREVLRSCMRPWYRANSRCCYAGDQGFTLSKGKQWQLKLKGVVLCTGGLSLMKK
jgi:hypothetical protein